MKPMSSTHYRKQKEGRCRRCKQPYTVVIYNQKVCLPCRQKCSKCNTTLTEDNIDKTSATKRKAYVCKSCVAATVKRSRGNAGFNQKAYDLKRLYNLSVEEYESFPKSCQICGSPEKLCVDHCHDTGVVRGILCSSCNFGLGHFKDKVDVVRRAYVYLDSFKKK